MTTKATHVISNADYILGILWEDKALGKVLVTTNAPINVNHDLTIKEVSTGKEVNHIDLREFLLRAVNFN
jgi:hypothetical protein